MSTPTMFEVKAMVRYSKGWLVMAAVLAVPGLIAAVLLWGLGRVSVVTLAVAIFVGLVLAISDGARDKAEPRQWPSSRVLPVAAGCGLGLVSVLGPVTLLGWPWLLLWAMVAVASPPALRLLHNRLSGYWSGPPPDTAGSEIAADTDTGGGLPVSAEQLTALDTRTLCWVWRCTADALRRSTCPAQTLRVAALREQLLEELGRRYPDRLEAWLASGAVGDPGRYVIDR